MHVIHITFDLRDIAGRVSKVKQQGHSNSCFSFVACETIQGLYNKLAKEPVDETMNDADKALYNEMMKHSEIELSPQDLYNNLIKDEIQDKKGYSIIETFAWIRDNGCVLEKTCPYDGKIKKCENREVVLRIEGHKPLRPWEIEAALRAGHPVAAQVHWTEDLNDLEADVVYSGPGHASAFETENDKHGVVIVGFGEVRRGGRVIKRFWIIKNSHGDGWSKGGFGFIDRGMAHGRYLIEDACIPLGISFKDLEGVPYGSLN
ncbi:hypothetical protein RIF29_38856 [Crotalaria pallida]|uniref:Peptidase C1A papain C-terminal domain-containing protein n=1 Tax=Crotalaria pallida TaxID=3830 RepID=A0AAN9HSS4_CROPI